MKAPLTFFIGLGVAVLSSVQFLLTPDPVRLVGITVGLFFVGFGWKIGWTRYRGFTVALGHVAVTAGCLVVAWAVYQLPMAKAPSLVEVLDLPLFWGLFTLMGGVCMIQHGTCACCIRQHERRNPNKAPVRQAASPGR